MNTSRFADPIDTPVLTLRDILGGKPVQYVEHDDNGGWHFLDSRSMFEGSELLLVPLARLLEADPTLDELADLPRGWHARRRGPTSPWERESRQKIRERTAALLKEMRETSKPAPPGSPSSTEL